MAADNDPHYLQSPKRSPTRAEVTNGVKQGRFYAKEIKLLDGTTVVKIVSSQEHSHPISTTSSWKSTKSME